MPWHLSQDACWVSEEVRQEAGPDVIWRPANAAWLHSFRVWTSHCLYLGLYLDYAYLYLRLYLRGTVHCLLISILSGESQELITMMKARVQRWKSLRYDCTGTWSFHLWPFDPVRPPLVGSCLSKPHIYRHVKHSHVCLSVHIYILYILPQIVHSPANNWKLVSSVILHVGPLMNLHLHWQQRWGLMHDHKDGESAFCLPTNDFSD